MDASRMVELLGTLVPKEGVLQDYIKGVDLFRITESFPRTPQKYDPGIIVLAQGRKRVFIGDEVYMYDPLNYLVLSVPLPLECEVFAPKEKPLLGFKVKVDATIIGELLLALDDDQHTLKVVPMAIYSAPLDDNLIDASVRLLESLQSPKDSRILGPMFAREIIYRVLCGEKGDALRALAYRQQRFFQISRTLDKIHEMYGEKLDLNTLAREAGMSISAFHSSFKAVTNIPPLQYIKNVRLHKARLLMVEEGLNANGAAYEVGYESPSQFNREYKRLFGLTPAKDAIHTS
jgi:AraC-like DNA-binding protein